MTFDSILTENKNGTGRNETQDAPACFGDLNLDQIVAAITAGKQEYNLAPFFHTPLRDPAAIAYRQEVMRDLENKRVMEAVRAFARRMASVRRYLALLKQLTFQYHKEGWFLEAAHTYCQAVNGLAHALGQESCTSRGLSSFRSFLQAYCASPAFTTLQANAGRIKAELGAIRYCVIFKNSTVRVRRYEEEADFSTEVERTFARFQQGAVKDYRVQIYESSGMNHIEAQILDYVARLYPDVFAALDTFYQQYGSFFDPIIGRFEREIQFYVATLEYLARFQPGLQFTCPAVTGDRSPIWVKDGFDLALAGKRLSEEDGVVTNDFTLAGAERILVVSGPNQGGKTTFARMFGQLHYLASLGCPVPARQARLALFDQIYTHFEKEEDIRSLSGKLQDDLQRIHAILEQASPDSILILNEIFNSTTLQDAVFLSQKIMEQLDRLDLMGVWVTFVDELAEYNEKTVSMVSTVVPENPAQRTYKVVRHSSNGLAYALSIAEKHRLTYQQIKERMQP